MSTFTSQRPLISIIMPVRNEALYVERAIGSLLPNKAEEFELEILAINGASTDSTATIIRELERQDRRIRYLYNAQRTTPVAFNIGLQAARGEYVCILGAHTEYDADYIACCLRELRRTGASGCSGGLTTCPANDRWQARLVATAFAHPFGSSRSSVRTQCAGFVETIPYPLFVKRVLLEVGGYDEQLVRNQDNDLNQRLRARGHKLYLTDKTTARLFARSTVWGLMKYGYLSGYWNLLTLRRNRAAMCARHFIPFAFVAAVVIGLICATGSLTATRYSGLLLLPLIAVLAAHLGVGCFFALRQWIVKHDPLSLLLPGVWLSFHTAYGCGTLAALLRNCVISPMDHKQRSPIIGVDSRE